jgi:hypothetical protein
VAKRDECASKGCSHSWLWPHGIIEGKKPDEIRVVRKCQTCGLKQMAAVPASAWKKAVGDYALDEHYA